MTNKSSIANYLTRDELLKALSVIDIYRQIDKARNLVYPMRDDIVDFIDNHIAHQEIITPIYAHENELCGFLSKYKDVLTISLPGLEGNLVRVYQLFTSFDHDDFYGISCPIASGLKIFYNNLHANLANMLYKYKYITRIQVVGFSYGSMIGQLICVVIEKLIRFSKGYISPQGQIVIEELYTNYIASNAWSILNIALKPENDIREQIMSFDRDLFCRVSFVYGCMVGVVNTFEDSILNDPDLNQPCPVIYDHKKFKICKTSFFDKLNMFILSNDPVGNILDKNTLLGKAVSILNGDSPRVILGKICILNTYDFMPRHNYTYYLNAITYALIKKRKIRVYTALNLPMPFPMFTLPYTNFDFIRAGGMLGFTSILQIVFGLTIEGSFLFWIFRTFLK